MEPSFKATCLVLQWFSLCPVIFFWYRCSTSLMAQPCGRLTLPTLSDDQLHQNQALARESSRQLTLLFADKSQNFTTTSQSQVLLAKNCIPSAFQDWFAHHIYCSYLNLLIQFQLPAPSTTPEVMKFGMGTQSQGIRDNLSKFSRFLEHFSQAKWLGDLIAPEFQEAEGLCYEDPDSPPDRSARVLATGPANDHVQSLWPNCYQDKLFLWLLQPLCLWVRFPHGHCLHAWVCGAAPIR